MADPRIISIDDSGIATWDTGNGSTMQTAYGGLPARLQQQYQQQVADTYTGGMSLPPEDLQSFQPQAPTFPAAPMSQVTESVAPDNAPFVAMPAGASGLAPFRAAPADSGAVAGVGAPALSIPGATAGGVMPAIGGRSAQAGEASPAARVEPAAAGGEGGFADPLAAGSGIGQSRLRELLDIQAVNPNARVGGAPGRMVTAQGPTQVSARVASEGLPGALQRVRQTDESLADAQIRELSPIATYRDAIALEMATQAQAAEQAQAAMAELEARRNARRAEEMAKYRQAADEHIAAEQRGIDPDHYFANRSTGQRIMSGIGLILSGIGSGLAGQENMAMKIINDAIERDLLAQRENIAGKGRAAERQRGVMGDVAQMYDDEAAQILASRALMWDASARRVGELEAMATGAEARANLATLREQMAAERARLELELEQQLGANVVTSERQVMAGGSAGTSVKDLIAAERARLQGATYDPERYVPQYGGVARTVDEAKKARQLASDSNTLNSFYNRALQVRQRYGSFTDPRARAELEALRSEALLIKKNVAQLGVLSQQDESIVNAAQGGDWSSFSNFDDARLKQAMRNLRVNEANAAREMVIELSPDELPEHERRRSTGGQRAIAAETFQPIGGR